MFVLNAQFAQAESVIGLAPAGQTQLGLCGGSCAVWHCLPVRAMIIGGLAYAMDDAET